MNRPIRFLATASVGAVSVAALAGCGGTSGSAEGTIDYWLWDANQLPAYKQCAEDFHKENPDITVKITQTAWDDYWSKLTNSMAAGTAPDVFTDHLAKFADFVNSDQLMPIDTSDIDMTQYAEGLADLWVGQDGEQYGLPKDWDTVALFYNKKFAADAGLTDEQMSALTWNPEDGGTFEEAIARLTVDKNGVHGDEPGFDKDNVAVHGLGLNASGAGNGQTEWSYLTGTTDWTHTDENPWGTHYNYDDERFQDTIAWWAGLVQKGYMPELETTVGASMPDNFGAGKTAMTSDGSWSVGQYVGYKDVEVGIVPTPVGPNGKNASMFNGLADGIWAGTDDKESAVKWVEYLASAACQDVVGEHAVVFPAITSSTEKAKAAFADKGIDITPFTQHVDAGTTFLFPITDNAAKIQGIMEPAMDAVVSGQADASTLSDANDQVNALFE